MTAFNFINLLFCFPETKFPQHDSSPKHRVLLHPEMEANPDNNPSKGNLDQVNPVEGRLTDIVGNGRPSKTQFKLWQTPDSSWKSFLFHDILAPVRLFLYPIIFWTGLNVAGPANLLLYWNLTESALLGSPPYNFSVSAVGYSNFAFVVGGVLGLATAGPLSDWIAAKSTARNNGIREAEMRLPALLPYLATSVVGILIGGIGFDRLWDWPVVLVVGYGFSGLCVTAVPTIAVAYAVDCYKPISGEIMVVATVIKNSCGFAMSYWVSPLAERRGWLVPSMVEFALMIGPMVLGIPLYYFGKRLRQLTRTSSVHLY